MKCNFPILIPIKGKSIRCPNKNDFLLPFTLNYLKKIKLLDNAIVITDCEALEKYAKSLGVKTHFEIRMPNQDELLSCYNYVENKNIDFFFLMPVTQPFRAFDLFSLFLEKEMKSGTDFIVSTCIYADRKNFYVEVKNADKVEFLHKNMKRRGKDCKQNYMIDGSLYLIKTTFLERVIENKNTNDAFWKGNFQVVINKAPFLDIDTLEDMEKFKYLLDFIDFT